MRNLACSSAPSENDYACRSLVQDTVEVTYSDGSLVGDSKARRRWRGPAADVVEPRDVLSVALKFTWAIATTYDPVDWIDTGFDIAQNGLQPRHAWAPLFFLSSAHFRLYDELFGAGKEAGRVVDANKLNHIFGKSGRNLEPLVEKFGSQEGAFNAVQDATQALAESQGLSGVFKTTVQVGGQDLVVKGNVIDGVVHIGTFWPPASP